jgi:predicted amidohydrolase YtcJ
MGVNVCLGTDFPVVGESPFMNMYYAMTRKVEGMDDEFFGEYKMSVEDCLTGYTINNAYASGEEDRRGGIRIGKIADVILTDDLFQMTPAEIKDAKVEMTFMNGKRVY